MADGIQQQMDEGNQGSTVSDFTISWDRQAQVHFTDTFKIDGAVHLCRRFLQTGQTGV